MILLDAERLKDAKLTLFLIFINGIFYIIFNIILPIEYLLFFAQINRNIIIDFEIWRLITPIFLHADFMHLFSNMFALLIFGATIETNLKISKLQYVMIYLISGLIGNLFTLILLPIDATSLGASGAIFGFLGVVLLMVATDDRSLLPSALIYGLYFIAASFIPGVNIWAHIAGLLGGLLCGYVFYYRKNRFYPSY
ncbi:MAG: rhomboid family intramembrane serine protease [Candidatus Hermodarchaeota archaeon]